MLLLGIETSCDETGAALIRTTSKTEPVTLLSNVIATSLALHAETGGIIPEVAAREQVRYILPVINQALREAGVTIEEIDAIAVTYGPGLIGSLLVGVETAKTLSYVYNKPLIPVNHLYGHIYANWLVRGVEHSTKSNENSPSVLPYALSTMPSATISFPALALVVSGGHTDLVLLKGHGDIAIIGGTRDDAAGEAFDKIGRLLGLPYPAGPLISKLALKGNPKAFSLPRPLIGSGDYDFSFSGLKTAVLNLCKKNGWENLNAIMQNSPLGETGQGQDDENEKILADICASVQEAIIDSIVRKTIKAAREYNVKSLILGGGVAANDALQQRLGETVTKSLPSTQFYAPPKAFCTDNAAMIAAAGFYNYQEVSWKDLTANPELYF